MRRAQSVSRGRLAGQPKHLRNAPAVFNRKRPLNRENGAGGKEIEGLRAQEGAASWRIENRPRGKWLLVATLVSKDLNGARAF